MKNNRDKVAATQHVIERVGERIMYLDGDIVGTYMGRKYVPVELFSAALDAVAQRDGDGVFVAWKDGDYETFIAGIAEEICPRIVGEIGTAAGELTC